MATDKINITTDWGESVEAVAPVIISASRSTDIPAFYTKWFFNRLEKGYCIWVNPFNQQKQYISFSRVRVIVFWTKNPAPIIPYLHILDEIGINYYFQVTINDYENEGLEPNLPSLDCRIKTFKKLSELIGREKVIWRFDPIILCETIKPKDILSKIWHIGNQLKRYTEKLVFSFVDINAYRKVQVNLIKETKLFTKENVINGEGNLSQKFEIISGLCEIRRKWSEEGWNLLMSTCAEEIDLKNYGIEHNCCIDGELMERLFGDDKTLIYYIHTGVLPVADSLFGTIPEIPIKRKSLKDSGQRKLCGCMISKDIGMYNTCRHFCVYCYANTSKKNVLDNQSKHSDQSECIIN